MVGIIFLVALRGKVDSSGAYLMVSGYLQCCSHLRTLNGNVSCYLDSLVCEIQSRSVKYAIMVLRVK